MMNFDILAPLESIFRSLLDLYLNLTNNAGFSVILLSFTVSLFLLPLFWIAEKLQEESKLKRSAMRSDLDKVATISNRQEKYFYTKEIYKIHGYHPIQSLTSLIGLFIQIPFFIAAFRMLSQYSGFIGVGFGPISDFSLSDGLLWGINILPIIMTAVNLFSGFLYSSDEDGTERIQLYLIAVIFLALLYNQPSALVLYWTMNNVFSIFRTMLFHRNEAVKRNISDALKNDLFMFLEKIDQWLKKYFRVLLIGLVIAFSFILISMWSHQSSSNSSIEELKQVLLGILIISYLVTLFRVLFIYSGERKKRTIGSSIIVTAYELALIGIFALLALSMFDRFSDYMKYIQPTVFSILILNILANLILISKNETQRQKSKRDDKPKYPIWEVGVFLYLTFILTPLAIYLSSPKDFGGTIGDVLLYSFRWLLICGLVISILLFLFRKRSTGTSKFIMTFTLISLIFGYLYQKNLGIMRGFRFVNESLLGVNTTTIIIDTLIILVSFYVVFKFHKRIRKFLLLVFSFVLIIQTITVSFDYIKKTRGLSETPLPVDMNPASVDFSTLLEGFSFSQTEDNILILFLDGFPGFLLEEYFSRNPQSKEIFQGFTWYPNAVSTGSYTYPSTPSMIGGHQYTVNHLNERTHLTYLQKNNGILQMHSDFFAGQGYSRSYFNLPPFFNNYGDLILSGANIISYEDLVEFRRQRVPEYVSEYARRAFEGEQIAVELQESALFRLSLFKLTPYVIKSSIYTRGFTFDTDVHSRQMNTLSRYRESDSFWSSLPYLIGNHSVDPTIRFFRTNAMNRPYHINQQGGPAFEEVLVGPFDTNGSEEALMTVEYEFQRMDQTFSRMRELDVFENTTIVLIADHGVAYSGNWHDSAVNPLFMIKEANQNEPLRISDRLVSNGDLFAITSQIASGESADIIPNPIEHELDRTLIYYGTSHGDTNNLSETVLPFERTIEVSDSIIGMFEWPLSNVSAGSGIFDDRNPVNLAWYDCIGSVSGHVKNYDVRDHAVYIESAGIDPFIVFVTDYDWVSNKEIALYIQFRTENPADFQFYFQTEDSPQFTEEHKLSFPTSMGTNDFYMLLPSNFNGVFRIDPDKELEEGNSSAILRMDFAQ